MLAPLPIGGVQGLQLRLFGSETRGRRGLLCEEQRRKKQANGKYQWTAKGWGSKGRGQRELREIRVLIRIRGLQDG